MILFGRVKNGILWLFEQARAKKLASFAERRQKSWAQHIILRQQKSWAQHIIKWNRKIKAVLSSQTIYSYNRAYLPEVKYLIGTEENLVNLYKNEIQKHSFESYYSGHLDTYNYNVKRAYDKIKYYYPNANISYEEKK